MFNKFTAGMGFAAMMVVPAICQAQTSLTVGANGTAADPKNSANLMNFAIQGSGNATSARGNVYIYGKWNNETLYIYARMQSLELLSPTQVRVTVATIAPDGSPARAQFYVNKQGTIKTFAWQLTKLSDNSVFSRSGSTTMDFIPVVYGSIGFFSR